MAEEEIPKILEQWNMQFKNLLVKKHAKDKSQDELAILSAFFTQLGDTLATLATLTPD